MKWQLWILPLFFINFAMLGEVLAAEATMSISFDSGYPKAGPKGSGKIVGSGSYKNAPDGTTNTTVTLIVTPTKDGEGVGTSPSACKNDPTGGGTGGTFVGQVTGLQPGTYNVSVQVRATVSGKPDVTSSTAPVQVTVE